MGDEELREERVEIGLLLRREGGEDGALVPPFAGPCASADLAEDEDLPDDTIVANYLGAPEPRRLVAALAVLRAAALSTYENRQLSTGALLLGSEDGSDGGPTLPAYDIRLSGVKGFHRLCDGVHSLFLVGLDGRLRHAVDVERWADEHGGGLAIGPCPRAYAPHARATAQGGHTALVLMPSHEIKVFHGGHFAWAFSVARWRILDIPTKARLWSEAVTDARVASYLFEAALDMSESRHGALFVVLDDAASVDALVAPSDRLEALQAPAVGGARPLAPRSKLIFANMMAGVKKVTDLDRSVFESLASLDGAIVLDREGNLLSFGAILRVPPGAELPERNPDGARTTIALIAAQYAAVLKVSEDGVLTMYHRGRRVWDV